MATGLWAFDPSKDLSQGHPIQWLGQRIGHTVGQEPFDVLG
jgi:hypothetical protein